LLKELKAANKKITLLKEAACATQSEKIQFRATVGKLQNIISKKCDLEGI